MGWLAQKLTETTKTVASVPAAGGMFHCDQTHSPNVQFSEQKIILIKVNTPTLEKRIVFHFRGAGTCRAARVWSHF